MLKMNEKELIEFTNQKAELIHFKKLLGEVKSVIELYQSNNKEEHHFDRIMKELESNGVKGTFDSAIEYDNYIKGVNND